MSEIDYKSSESPAITVEIGKIEPSPSNDLGVAVGTSILSGAAMLGLSLLRG